MKRAARVVGMAVTVGLGVLGVLGAASLAGSTGCSKFSGTEDVPEEAGAPDGSAPPVTVAQRIYVFGGATAAPPPAAPQSITGGVYANVMSDGKLDAWTSVSWLEEDRYAAAYTGLDGVLYAFGGTFQASPYAKSGDRGPIPSDLTASTPIWKGTTAMNEGRNSAAAFVHGGFVYVAGGANGPTSAVGSIERYDTGTGLWSTVGALGVAVSGQTMAVRQSKIYSIGGKRSGPAGITAGVDSASFTDDGKVGPFTSEGAALPLAVAYAGQAAVDDLLFVIGGETTDGLATDNVSQGTFANGELAWAKAAAFPHPGGQRGIAEACVLAVGRTIYVIGGRDKVTADALVTVHVGHVTMKGALEWDEDGPPLPRGRAAASCVVSPSSAP